MRAFTDTFNTVSFPGTRVLIGETNVPRIADLALEYGTLKNPEFQLPMDTRPGFINKLDVAAFRAKLTEANAELNGNVPLLVFDNHDVPRLDLRYGDGVHDVDIQRILATILFTSRGASLFYYGDEIGMTTTPPTRKEDVRDPVGLVGWPKFKGRDGERTPMQWSNEPNAGFTRAGVKPWLPIPVSYRIANVKVEDSQPDSLLNWYRALIHLKKTKTAFAIGDEIMIDTSNNNVLSWVRRAPGTKPIVISLNFTAETRTVSLHVLGAKGTLQTLLKTPGATDPYSLDRVTLRPFGVFVGEMVVSSFFRTFDRSWNLGRLLG